MMSGMTTCWGRFLGIAMGSAMSGAIAFWANCALAQNTPDGTLPNVIQNITLSPIPGRLIQWFPSLQELFVFTGGTTFFNNPVNQQFDTSCTPGSRQQASSFVITGRGGLPLNPREAFNSDTVRVDWVTLNLSNDNRARQTVNIKPTTATPKPIVEATGWVKNEKGEVVLTANALTTTPHGSWRKPVSCSAS